MVNETFIMVMKYCIQESGKYNLVKKNVLQKTGTMGFNIVSLYKII